MKHPTIAHLGIVLAIPLIMAGCQAPEPHDANSEQVTHANDDDAGGGWCPMSALATCRASCDVVAECAFPPFFPEVDAEACAFSCASALMEDAPEVERVVSCLSEVTSEHACCEITGCAAGWLIPTAPEAESEEVTPDQEDVPDSDVVPLAVALDSSACPASARFATNGEGRGFCLFEDVVLPGPHLAEPYCHFLWDDYIGFSWLEVFTPPDYVCPEASDAASNLAGTSFCIYHALNAPDTPSLAPYCHFLEDGTLGYSWCLDPLAPGCGDTSPAQPDGTFVTPVSHDDVAPTQPPTPTEDTPTTTSGESTSAEDAHEADTGQEEMDGAPFIVEDEDATVQDDVQDDEMPADEVDEEEDDEASPGSADEPTVETDDGMETQQPMGDGTPEDLDQEEVDLPEPVSPETPGEDQEDLRCQSMCERIDFCDGLEGSAVAEVSSCVSLCHTWGATFSISLFYCNLESAETCAEVLACWTPGGPRH